MKKIIQNWRSLLRFAVFAVSSFAFASAPVANAAVSNLDGLIGEVKRYMGYAVPIIVGLAVIAFMYGVLMFIWNAGDDTKREEGKMFILYGLIGLAVMTTLWGLVRIFAGTFGFPIGLPSLKPQSF